MSQKERKKIYERAVIWSERSNREGTDENDLVGDCPKATGTQISTAKVCRIISLNAQHVLAAVYKQSVANLGSTHGQKKFTFWSILHLLAGTGKLYVFFFFNATSYFNE